MTKIRSNNWSRGAVALVAAVLSVLGSGPASLHAAEPPAVDPLDAVAERNGLERVRDDAGLQAATTLLQPYTAISGDVVRVDAVMRRIEPGATLWLVDYRSRAQGPRLNQGRRTSIDVPLLAIVLELDRARDWESYRQSADTPVPPGLPEPWHRRLAAMSEYRMGIEGNTVAFFSQLQSSALVHIAETGTSPEFKPGLRNSALRLDVQRALDIVAAMPDGPRLARFMRIDGAKPDLPSPDRAPLDRMNATMAEARAESHEAGREAVRAMSEAGEESRRRAEADRERFRPRMAELTSGTRAGRDGTAAAPAEPAVAPDTDTDAAADSGKPK